MIDDAIDVLCSFEFTIRGDRIPGERPRDHPLRSQKSTLFLVSSLLTSLRQLAADSNSSTGTRA
jgi:hypothetical protein